MPAATAETAMRKWDPSVEEEAAALRGAGVGEEAYAFVARDVCKASERKVRLLLRWLAVLASGRTIAELPSPGLEITAVPRDARERFVGEVLGALRKAR